MSYYELAILGNASDEQRAILTETLRDLTSDYDLTMGADVLVFDGATIAQRHNHVAFAATYFGGKGKADVDVATRVTRSSAPIIPTLGPSANFASDIPNILHNSNGLRLRHDDPSMLELATALLECVGLIRRQRRVFVSYRRTESRSAAVQLHDLLCARGFDVFLDTHDIRPGDSFQEVLWHRLCDSDVLIMLDTSTYFESKWTMQELGRARAKDIHVLRVVWPRHQPNKLTEMAETIYLEAPDLQGLDGPIEEKRANTIVLAVENLRSRSIASRYMSITGKFRAEVERIGGSLEGIGAHRAISVRLPDKRALWAYPVVGIPTAELLNDIAEKAKRADYRDTPVLVYDHIGIGDQWTAHLKWLDENIRVVRFLKVHEASWMLAAW